MFNPITLLCSSDTIYSYRNFPNHNDDFANFVLSNRMNNAYNENPHNYDLIWGVMSDNNPSKIISDYKEHLINRETAISQLKKSNSMRQLYISNQNICNLLKIKEIIKEVE